MPPRGRGSRTTGDQEEEEEPQNKGYAEGRRRRIYRSWVQEGLCVRRTSRGVLRGAPDGQDVRAAEDIQGESLVADWIPTEEFERTEYGRLNKTLDPKKYFGPLDRSKLPEGSTVVPDPKDGHFGIIRDSADNPVGKVELT